MSTYAIPGENKNVEAVGICVSMLKKEKVVCHQLSCISCPKLSCPTLSGNQFTCSRLPCSRWFCSRFSGFGGSAR